MADFTLVIDDLVSSNGIDNIPLQVLLTVDNMSSGVTVTSVAVTPLYMIARAIYDYLPITTPDNNITFRLRPQRVLLERGKKNQIVRLGDDSSEEVISLSSKPIFYAELSWDYLRPAESGEIIDFYYNPLKGDGVARTFKWLHPTDGQTYVVRFDSEMERSIRLATLHGINSVRFKILGKIATTKTTDTTTSDDFMTVDIPFDVTDWVFDQ